jgi:hypothetical protein
MPVCSDCNLTLSKGDFSKSQFKKKKATENNRRCISCAKVVDSIASNNNAVSKAVPKASSSKEGKNDNNNMKSNDDKTTTTNDKDDENETGSSSSSRSSSNKQQEKRPILDASTIKKMYNERSVLRTICAYPPCGITETRTKPHKQCAKCKCAKYCSNECYKAHYPVHKLICKPPTRSLSTETTKGSPDQRLAQFLKQYSPLLATLASYSLWRGTDAKKHGLYSTHVLYILVDDLPSSVKSPRLYIKYAALMKVEDIDEDKQGYFYTSQKDAPIQSCLYDSFDFCACVLMEYEGPDTIEGLVPVASTMQAFNLGGDLGKNLKKTLGFCTEDGYFDLDNKIDNDIYDWILKLYLQEEIDTITNTINEMANGNAKDLKAASKLEK